MQHGPVHKLNEPIGTVFHPAKEVESETKEERAHRQTKELTKSTEIDYEARRASTRMDKIAKALPWRRSARIETQPPVHPRVIQLNQLKQQMRSSYPQISASTPYPKPQLTNSGEIPESPVHAPKVTNKKSMTPQWTETGPDRALMEEQVDDIILRMLDSRRGIVIKKHRKLFKSYADSFSGKDLVTWLVGRFDWTREKAIQKGQSILLSRGALLPLSAMPKGLLDKSTKFYRLKLMDDPMYMSTLNDIKCYQDEIEDPLKLSEQLIDMVVGMMTIPHTETNFSSIRKSKLFFKFWLRTCALQKVAVDCMTNQEKIVFFVNIHNALIVHNSILHGPPKSKLDIKNALTKTYRIGRYEYSLQLIRLILCGQLPEENALPREDIQLHPTNPMVHFCLFSATNQSPTIRSYTLADFEEMCAQQAKQYLAEQTELREDFSQIWLPRMLHDHSKEFGGSVHEMLYILSDYFPRRYQKYINNNLDELDVKFKDSTFDSVRYIREGIQEEQ